MSAQAKREYVEAIYQRYRRAKRAEKRQILDEFCQVAAYHRKSAIRLLTGPAPGAVRPPRHRDLRYSAAAIEALRAIWEAAGYPWSRRLKALLPLWMPWARRRLHLRPAVERQVLAISPRQMDRRLAPHRRQLRKRLYGRTKPGTLLKHHIPLKTDRWDVVVPGFTEIDLVAHCGSLGDGEFVHSLNLTDIHTTWVETAAVLGKSQVVVQAALDELRQALPFRLRGIDSDNGSEFINHHLWDYCQVQEIQFTRGRPYKKDDNAHIEQKNWTHVRKLLGYLRYDSPAAQAAIHALYRHELRLFQNLFLPRSSSSPRNASGRESVGATTPPARPWSGCSRARRSAPRWRPSSNGNAIGWTPSPSPLRSTPSSSASSPSPTPTIAHRPPPTGLLPSRSASACARSSAASPLPGAPRRALLLR